MPIDKDQLEKALFQTLKGGLSIAGGATGAGLGTAAGLGPGSPVLGTMGAIGGAGLGYGAGQSIENTIRALQGQDVNPNSAYTAIPEGAAQEMVGQGVGKALGGIAGALINKFKPVSSDVKAAFQALQRTPEGNPAVEYHGSISQIENPYPSSKYGLEDSKIFFTSPNKAVANFYAAARTGQNHMPLIPLDSLAQAKPNVSAYYLNPGNEITFNANNLEELGKALNLSEYQIGKAIRESAGKEDVANEVMRKYIRGMAENQDLSFRGAQAALADALKTQNISRLRKPLALFPGTGQLAQETLNFFPEKDLVYKPAMDQALQAENATNNLNEQGKKTVQNLINLLSQSATRNQKEQ